MFICCFDQSLKDDFKMMNFRFPQNHARTNDHLCRPVRTLKRHCLSWIRVHHLIQQQLQISQALRTLQRLPHISVRYISPINSRWLIITYLNSLTVCIAVRSTQTAMRVYWQFVFSFDQHSVTCLILSQLELYNIFKEYAASSQCRTSPPVSLKSPSSHYRRSLLYSTPRLRTRTSTLCGRTFCTLPGAAGRQRERVHSCRSFPDHHFSL